MPPETAMGSASDAQPPLEASAEEKRASDAKPPVEPSAQVKRAPAVRPKAAAKAPQRQVPPPRAADLEPAAPAAASGSGQAKEQLPWSRAPAGLAPVELPAGTATPAASETAKGQKPRPARGPDDWKKGVGIFGGG
jgi:hypothetical protein